MALPLVPIVSTFLACAASAALEPACDIAPREEFLVESTALASFSTSGVAVASVGDLSAFAYSKDDGSGGMGFVYLLLGDRDPAVEDYPFPAPSPILTHALGGPPKLRYVQRDSLHIVGSMIYVSWAEVDPNTGQIDIRLRIYDTGAADWLAAPVLVQSFPTGADQSQQWRMAVSPESSSNLVVHVYFLLAYVVGGGSSDRLRFSHGKLESGVLSTPMTTLVFPDFVNVDVDALALAADGKTVHVAWEDDRNLAGKNDAFYLKSSDAGTTWPTSTLKQLSTTAPQAALKPIDLAIRPGSGRIVAGWLQTQVAASTKQELRARMFLGGNWTANDVKVGSYLGTDDVNDLDLAFSGCTQAVATWSDRRSGSDRIYVAHSSTGTSWAEVPATDQSISGLGATDPLFAMERPGCSSALIPDVAVLWRESGAIKGSWSAGGLSGWTNTFQVSQVAPCQLHAVAYNVNGDELRNVVCAWAWDDPGDVSIYRTYGGGFVPQEFSPGMHTIHVPATIALGWSRFRPPLDQGAIGIFSTLPGIITLPNLSDISLQFDTAGLLLASLSWQFLHVTLDSAGNAMSAPLALSANLAGATIHAAAFGYSIGPGGFKYGNVTDRFKITFIP